MNEKEVKEAARERTHPFHFGMLLHVVGVDRNTATVEFFSGRESRTARIEYVPDDQLSPCANKNCSCKR